MSRVLWNFKLFSKRPGFCRFLQNKIDAEWLTLFSIYRFRILWLTWTYPADIYLFKVNNRNCWTGWELCLKLTIKTPNFEQFSHNRPYNFGTFYGNFSQSSIKYLSKCRLKYFQLFCYCQVRNLEGQAISSLKNYMTHINLGSKYPTNSCLFFFFFN